MYPYTEKTKAERERLIALLGITEVAQMELQYYLIQFFAHVPEIMKLQQLTARMTPNQAQAILEAFARIVG